jgi:hypothetical protein
VGNIVSRAVAANASSALAGMSLSSSDLEVQAHAAAFFVALLKNGFFEEAGSFVDWYVETFGESDAVDAWSEQLEELEPS